MKNAGVQRIIGSSIGWHWYPDPYSDHTIRVLRSLYNRDVDHPATSQEQIDTLKKEIPSLFSNATPISDTSQIFDLTQVFEVQLKDTRYRIWDERKVYIHFPQVPMIENNRVIAINLSLNDKDSLTPAMRVLDSLDTPPSDWQAGECLLRPIDKQWFMAICRGYH